MFLVRIFANTQSKNDLAQDLCRKTLLENKSCSQAWEILGLIFEKEANYDLASDAYAKVTYGCFVVALCCSVFLYLLRWGAVRWCHTCAKS